MNGPVLGLWSETAEPAAGSTHRGSLALKTVFSESVIDPALGRSSCLLALSAQRCWAEPEQGFEEGGWGHLKSH